MRKIVLSITMVLIFLSGCSEVSTKQTFIRSSEVKSDAILFDDVLRALGNQNLHIAETELPVENVYIQNLNHVIPEAYAVEGKTLSIYVFPSEKERKRGMEEFEYLTATMELVSSKIFTKDNVLLFYVIGDETKKEVIRKIEDAVDTFGYFSL